MNITPTALVISQDANTRHGLSRWVLVAHGQKDACSLMPPLKLPNQPRQLDAIGRSNGDLTRVAPVGNSADSFLSV